MSTIEITKKIVEFEVINYDNKPEIKKIEVKRPFALNGKTYKIEKSPVTEYNIYVTINDIEINGKLYPFEIFINSKDLSNQMFIVAMTRLISSIFKNAIYSNSSVGFIVKDLKSIYDASGKFYRKGHKIVPSLVAEIGEVIDLHLQNIGLKEIKMEVTNVEEIDTTNLCQCPHCGSIALSKQNGCDICLECGYSRCS